MYSLIFLSALIPVIHSTTNVTLIRFEGQDFGIANNTAQQRNEARSVAECIHLCMETWGDKCTTVAFKEDQVPKCLMSSESLTTEGEGISVANYTVYSAEEPCKAGYRKNPISQTCVGVYDMSLTWQAAKEHCESIGEYFLTLETWDDAEWLYRERELQDEFFVSYGHMGLFGGLSTADWRWVGRVTGLLTYDHWRSPNQPNGDGDCTGAVGQADALLADYVCTSLGGHYCEYTVVRF